MNIGRDPNKLLFRRKELEVKDNYLHIYSADDVDYQDPNNSFVNYINSNLWKVCGAQCLIAGTEIVFFVCVNLTFLDSLQLARTPISKCVPTNQLYISIS